MARILVIDDSPTDLHAIKAILEPEGHQLIEAADGEQGIEKARGSRPDLILMDIVMPGMNGFQATRRLNRDADTASIPVIMVSSKDQATDRIWAKRQGAVDYIAKPVEKEELLEKIRAALGG
ncbi:twitching motility two-component system response regulator PilH [Alkalispirillum mobile]|uniref:Twitching motility two-component system response regulator PilH n=1 Tax=Alkalispirillum mobile TaxID=85925 RepID=A0A498CGD7_9GAMM|nr:response regulator [Alkalispirillum mobile]RLK51391.1 twitching motility two-component system response regulator PilH [Alkalispirillum mobile]